MARIGIKTAKIGNKWPKIGQKLTKFWQKSFRIETEIAKIGKQLAEIGIKNSTFGIIWYSRAGKSPTAGKRVVFLNMAQQPSCHQRSLRRHVHFRHAQLKLFLINVLIIFNLFINNRPIRSIFFQLTASLINSQMNLLVRFLIAELFELFGPLIFELLNYELVRQNGR